MSDQPSPRLVIDWLQAEIEAEEEECRRIAKRDGVPSEWIETVLAKIRGDYASRA